MTSTGTGVCTGTGRIIHYLGHAPVTALLVTCYGDIRQDIEERVAEVSQYTQVGTTYLLLTFRIIRVTCKVRGVQLNGGSQTAN